jgi:membrane protease YdiL (CAAX protease family)/DNA-directed RNA polymerase subunit RPC12/RpoP
MSLKYNCPLCGFEIISDFLSVGDLYRCPSCGNKIFVPDNATNTDQAPNLPKDPIDNLGNKGMNVEEHTLKADDDLLKKEVVKKKRPKEWGVWSVIKFVIAYFLAIIPIYFLSKLTAEMISFFIFHDRYFEEIHRLIFAGIAYFVPIILIYYSVVIRHGNVFFAALKLSRISKKEIIFYTIISIIIVIAISALGILIEITPLKNYVPESVPLDEYFNKGYFMLAFFSFMVIMGPFQEELIFRGYIYQGLKNSFGTLTSGILVTVLFAGLHARQLGNSLVLLIPILIGSIIFIAVRIKTDSLTKCVIVHQIYNTTLVILIWTLLIVFGLDSMKQ